MATVASTLFVILKWLCYLFFGSLGFALLCGLLTRLPRPRLKRWAETGGHWGFTAVFLIFGLSLLVCTGGLIVGVMSNERPLSYKETEAICKRACPGGGYPDWTSDGGEMGGSWWDGTCSCHYKIRPLQECSDTGDNHEYVQ